LAISVLGNRIN